MKNNSVINSGLIINFLLILVFSNPIELVACSTFKLEKNGNLIYGHNLNEGDIGVSGLVFINKRSVFKMGRTLTELTTSEKTNPSSHSWISRYGSVTFNIFGNDLPDGGMNEEGLYIWEMNEEADYPKNENLPKLNQMNWMQYILDNYSSVDQAINCASEIEIDGWGWHYFVGDAKGNTAVIAFIDGKVSIVKNKDMSVPGLFNSPYNRELELIKYYEGFGGSYKIDLDDPNIPRFVKTAQLIHNYNPEENIVDYGFYMLDKIKVDDIAEWSIVYDAKAQMIYFKTRINPSIKSIALNKIDFSNSTPTQILNMDIEKKSNVNSLFEPYTNEIMSEFIESLLIPILPESFFTVGGITLDEYISRFSNHSEAAKQDSNQFFKGKWETKIDGAKTQFSIGLTTIGNAVKGLVSNEKDVYEIDHLNMIGRDIKFTFKTHGGILVEIKANINDNLMSAKMLGIEQNMGDYTFYKKY